jgi:hypothetical protein
MKWAWIMRSGHSGLGEFDFNMVRFQIFHQPRECLLVGVLVLPV